MPQGIEGSNPSASASAAQAGGRRQYSRSLALNRPAAPRARRTARARRPSTRHERAAWSAVSSADSWSISSVRTGHARRRRRSMRSVLPSSTYGPKNEFTPPWPRTLETSAWKWTRRRLGLQPGSRRGSRAARASCQRRAFERLALRAGVHGRLRPSRARTRALVEHAVPIASRGGGRDEEDRALHGLVPCADSRRTRSTPARSVQHASALDVHAQRTMISPRDPERDPEGQQRPRRQARVVLEEAAHRVPPHGSCKTSPEDFGVHTVCVRRRRSSSSSRGSTATTSRRRCRSSGTRA